MNIKRVAASGVRWMAMAEIVTTALQLLQTAILARLLAPADFGLMAMVLVVVGFAQAYVDMGVSNALIFRQDTTREQLSSLYWLNLLAGFAVFSLTLLAAPLIAAAFNEPRLRDLVALTAVVFLIVPLGQQFRVLLQKHLRFRDLAFSETSAALVGAVMAVTAALKGYGVYALIIGHLGASATRAVLFIRLGWREWRPGLHFRLRDLRGYVSFGLYQMGERTINYFGNRWDQMLIGSTLGAQALGYYLLAHLLAIQPVRKLNPVIMRVAFPLLARFQDRPDALKAGYLMTLRTVTSVTFPVLMGLGVSAPWLIPILFGEPWLPAVPLLQILAAVALLRSAGNPIGALLLSRGRAGLAFRWNVAFVVLNVPALIAGIELGGILGVAGTVLAVEFLVFSGVYLFLVRSQLGPCLGEFLGSLGPPFGISALMAVSVPILMHLGNVDSVLILGLIIIAAALLYASLYYLLQRDQFLQFKELILGG